MKERNEPEWTFKNQNMKKGDTTLKTCGWCTHRGGGSYRYDCMLSGDCSLLKSYDNEVEWNTPCRIKTLGGADIQDIIESKKHDIKEAQDTIKRTKEEIEQLKKLTKEKWFRNDNANRPPLPKSRNYDHFKVGDIVYVFWQKHEVGSKSDWYRATVVKGYRHHDGCVSFVFDNPALDGGGAGNCRPDVLLEKEFNYLRKHLEIVDDWFYLAYKDLNDDFDLKDHAKKQLTSWRQ